jgi:hypothetical protein
MSGPLLKTRPRDIGPFDPTSPGYEAIPAGWN